MLKKIIKPKKADLMRFVGEKVIIRFKDGSSVGGQLCYADDFSERHDYRKPEMFYINSISFRVSNVKEIRMLCK